MKEHLYIGFNRILSIVFVLSMLLPFGQFTFGQEVGNTSITNIRKHYEQTSEKKEMLKTAEMQLDEKFSSPKQQEQAVEKKGLLEMADIQQKGKLNDETEQEIVECVPENVSQQKGTKTAYYMYMQDGTYEITCTDTYTFYDDGLTGNYYNNEEYTLKIRSGTGCSVKVEFTSFSTEQNFDILKIYDGASASATLI